MDGGCVPLPTHPQRHCVPASLVYLGQTDATNVNQCRSQLDEKKELRDDKRKKILKGFVDVL